MKYFSRFLSIFCLLFFSLTAFAGTSINCPSISTIANAKFFKAKHAFDHNWELVSRDLLYENYQWNVYLLVKLPDTVKTVEEALKQGQVFFETNVKFSGPTPLNDTSLPPNEDYPIICSYDAGVPGYGVLAQSPPLRRL